MFSFIIVLYNSLSLKRIFLRKNFRMEKFTNRKKKKKNVKFEIYFIGKDR